MKGLLFLYKLAFLCNLLFLVCLLMQRGHLSMGNQDIKSLLIIMGWLLAPILNLSANIWFSILLTQKKGRGLSAWLSITNFLILLVQIFIYFIQPA